MGFYQEALYAALFGESSSHETFQNGNECMGVFVSIYKVSIFRRISYSLSLMQLTLKIKYIIGNRCKQ